MTHPPRGRAWTPALMLHLTNPYAKQKVPNLTKPKGNIYKMEFLYHYITLILLTPWELMVFHWSLNDRKSPQVSRTLLSILAVLKNDVAWMVFTHPPTSKSSSPFNYYYCYYYYYYVYSFWVFHVSVSWWSFNGVWVTASLLKSPGLFSVIWPFSIMLSFGWSPLGYQLPSSPVHLVIL